MSSADVPRIPGAVSGLGDWLDDRFGGARGVRTLMRKVFPDHWTFMLGEIALWSFVILLLTGTYLALFFKPSMAPVVYHGSYAKLDGITVIVPDFIDDLRVYDGPYVAAVRNDPAEFTRDEMKLYEFLVQRDGASARRDGA